jgi:hypothetical protein
MEREEATKFIRANANWCVEIVGSICNSCPYHLICPWFADDQETKRRRREDDKTRFDKLIAG